MTQFFFRPEPINFIGSVVPFVQNKRVATQQGTFLCKGNVEQTFLNNLFELESIEPSKTWLKKFILSSAMRDEALSQLRKMNITRSSLFPDVEGLVRSFKTNYYINLFEARKIRTSNPDLNYKEFNVGE